MSDLADSVDDFVTEVFRRLNDLEGKVAAIALLQEIDDKMPKAAVLDLTQVADVLGVSRPTVYRLIASGSLPARTMLVTGKKGRTVVLRDDLRSFLREMPKHHD